MNRHDDVERYCYVFMFWIATSCFNSVTQLPADVVAVDGKRLEALYCSMSAAYFFLSIYSLLLAMYRMFVEYQRERLYEYKVIKKKFNSRVWKLCQ